MRVTVLYFAALRDLVGREQEELDLPGSVTTVGEFATYLARVNPALAGRLDSVRIAQNEEFVPASTKIEAGAALALIPPVSGG